MQFYITYIEELLVHMSQPQFFLVIFVFCHEISFIIPLHYCILIYFPYFLFLSESQNLLKGIRAISQFSPELTHKNY